MLYSYAPLFLKLDIITILQSSKSNDNFSRSYIQNFVHHKLRKAYFFIGFEKCFALLPMLSSGNGCACSSLTVKSVLTRIVLSPISISRRLLGPLLPSSLIRSNPSASTFDANLLLPVRLLLLCRWELVGLLPPFFDELTPRIRKNRSKSGLIRGRLPLITATPISIKVHPLAYTCV